MRYLILFLFIMNSIFSSAQTGADNTAKNFVDIRIKEIKSELHTKGIDTILSYVDWSITDMLTYYGKGMLVWKENGQYFLRTVIFNTDKNVLVESKDQLIDGKIITDFFSQGIETAKDDTLTDTIRRSHTNTIEVKFEYGNKIFEKKLDDHILYSQNAPAVKWIFSMSEMLEKSLHGK